MGHDQRLAKFSSYEMNIYFFAQSMSVCKSAEQQPENHLTWGFRQSLNRSDPFWSIKPRERKGACPGGFTPNRENGGPTNNTRNELPFPPPPLFNFHCSSSSSSKQKENADFGGGTHPPLHTHFTMTDPAESRPRIGPVKKRIYCVCMYPTPSEKHPPKTCKH